MMRANDGEGRKHAHTLVSIPSGCERETGTQSSRVWLDRRAGPVSTTPRPGRAERERVETRVLSRSTLLFPPALFPLPFALNMSSAGSPSAGALTTARPTPAGGAAMRRKPAGEEKGERIRAARRGFSMVSPRFLTSRSPPSSTQPRPPPAACPPSSTSTTTTRRA